jgi:sulfur carrier protein ThiS
MQKNEIQIYSAPLPFSNKQVKATAIFGMNLSGILDFVCPDINFNLVAAVVIVDGKIIPKDNWANTYPTANSIVNIRIIPQGGVVVAKTHLPLFFQLQCWLPPLMLVQGLLLHFLCCGCCWVFGIFFCLNNGRCWDSWKLAY